MKSYEEADSINGFARSIEYPDRMHSGDTEGGANRYPRIAPSLDEINSLLHQNDQAVNIFYSFGQFLDIVPVRASKGFALRWFTDQWDIPIDHVLAAGGSGADEDMMRGNTLAVVVANRHNEELSELTDVERIYYAQQPFAAGILEAIRHYKFLDTCGVPPE